MPLQAEPIKVGISTWNKYPSSVQGFKRSLTEQGLIEGKDIVYLEKSSGANKEKQREIAEFFKSEKVDLVYSLTTSGTIIIKEILPEKTPIVFSIVTFPADAGLIESFEYSANNLVGTSNYIPEDNFHKLLKSVFPTAKNVVIFHRYGEPNSKIQAINLKRLMKKTGADVKIVAAESLDDLNKKAAAAIEKLHPEVLVTTTDTLMQSGGEQVLIKLANKNNIAILSSNKMGIELGATLGSVADFKILGAMSGLMASKILKEGTLPTHMATKTQAPPLILVNKTAIKKLKLTIPDHLVNVKYVD
jgi:putative ABC transport system substrate-binding protein